MPSNVLFISHNAADRPFAVALQNAIHELVASKTLIDVRFSTSDEAGPQGGEKWREWIHRQIVEFHTALIVVTPNALGKPWLLWEAGACFGAVLTSDAKSQLIVSVAFGLTENECPDPLRGEQIILGTDAERVKQLFLGILRAHGIAEEVIEVVKRHGMEGVLQRYLATVRTAMLQTPSLVNEANVQDWLARLAEYVKDTRVSELGGFQRWMTLAFGRDAEGAGVPIDVRLHRQLGEFYLGKKQFALAVEQLMLARRAAPRDIYVLRPLAEAAMKHALSGKVDDGSGHGREQIESVLAAIEELDGRAFVSTPDAAALYGKYLHQIRGDRESARQAYESALQENPDSYYLADLLAQLLLEQGNVDRARDLYRQTLGIIDRLAEPNVWSHATAAAAHVALGDVDGARRRLAAIVALPGALNDATIDSVSGGLRKVASRTGITFATVDELLSALVTPA